MEYVSGNIFIREMKFEKAGQSIDGHAHNFDHTTYVAHGALRIERLDNDGNVEKASEVRSSRGYNWTLIKAGVRHRITALEDGTVGHCIYAHRSPQGEIVQVYDGWTPGYV
jgi:quercetin dioxygenase-like cupin family protein